MTEPGVTLCGFAGDITPRSTFPTVTGTRFFMGMPDVEAPPLPVYVGDEAIEMRSSLRLGYPCDGWGVDSINWYYLERIWSHIFNKILNSSPEEHPTLIVLDPRVNQEFLKQVAEILFGTLRVPAAGFGDYGYLCSVAANTPSACVVHIGSSDTVIIPVINGHTNVPAVKSLHIGDRILTDYFRRLLRRHGIAVENDLEVRSRLEHILTTLGYVAISDPTMSQGEPVRSEVVPFPEQGNVELTTELFEPAELFFYPAKIGNEDPSLPSLIATVIKNCEKSIHAPLLGNIILSGLMARLPGFTERLQAELSSSFVETDAISVKCLSSCDFGPWLGGSMLANKPGALNSFLWKDKYIKHEFTEIWFVNGDR